MVHSLQNGARLEQATTNSIDQQVLQLIAIQAMSLSWILETIEYKNSMAMVVLFYRYGMPVEQTALLKQNFQVLQLLLLDLFIRQGTGPRKNL